MASGVELATAWVRLVPTFEGVNANVAKAFAPAENEAGKAGDKAGKKFSTKTKAAITAASGVMVAGAVAAFKGLYEIGDTFDDVTKTIRAGTGAQGDALNDLVKSAKAVGKDVPADFKKVGTTVADLNTRMGLSGKTLETVSKQYLEAGRILGEDIDIKATSAAFNAFGLEGDAVAASMDSLFQISQATGVGINELATQVQQAAPALMNLGFSFEDSAALAGSLDKAGLNTSQVMASLSRSLVNLAKDGEEPQAAFQRVTGELQTFVSEGNTAAALDLAGKVFGTRGAGQFVGALQSGTLNMEDLMAATGATADTILGVGEETLTFADRAKQLGNQAMLALEPLATELLTGMQNTLTDLMPVFEAVGTWMAENAGVVKAFAIALGILTVAIIAANVAMWALSLNPIVALILRIVAVVGLLVGAVIWLVSEWDMVSQFISDVWNTAMNWIADVTTWLWETILEPVFTAIADIVDWVWTHAIKPIVDLVVNYFRFWAAVALWLWEHAVEPAIQAIGDIIEWLWENVISPVVKWISERLADLGAAFDLLYQNFVKPVFDKIADVVSTVWEWIDAHVFTPFKAGIDLIGQAFENTAKAIGIAWEGIKEAAAAPINFVLDTVWNNGLRSFWNDMVTELGLEDMKLPAAKLVKFASGGVMPGYTPGRDVHQFYSPTGGRLALSGGEAIMRPEFTRAVGGLAGVNHLNSLARSGNLNQAFANGGVWDAVGSFAGDVWDNVSSAVGVAVDFISNPLGAIEKHIIGGIIDPLMAGAGDNIFLRTVGQLPINLVKGLADRFVGQGAGGTAGMGWEAMWSIIQSGVPGAIMTSNFRPGATTVNGGQSYHALGRALDIIPATMETFNAVARLFPNASELIYTPAGSRQLLNGKPFNNWSEAVKKTHYDHIHLAMALGGVIPGLQTGGTVTRAGYAVVGEQGPELLKLPAGAQVNPDYDEIPEGGSRPVIFNNYAPVGRTLAQELDSFANRAEELL